MPNLLRLSVGFFLLGIYRLSLVVFIQLAKEVETIIGVTYNYITEPLAGVASIILFGYMSRWLCRVVERAL